MFSAIKQAKKAVETNLVEKIKDSLYEIENIEEEKE